MIKVALYIACLSMAVAVAVWFANEPGSVVIDWQGWRMDTSVAVLVILLLATTGLLLVLFRLTRLAVDIPAAFLEARRERRFRKGLESIGIGFAALHAGKVKAAIRYAEDAQIQLRGAPVAKFLALQAARLANNDDDVSRLSGELQDRPETQLAIKRELISQDLTLGEYGAARQKLSLLVTGREVPAWVVEALVAVALAEERWSEATDVLSGNLAIGHLNQEDRERALAKLYVLSAKDAVDKGEATVAARNARKALAIDGQSVAATVAYSQSFKMLGKHRKATSVIEKKWLTSPDYRLLEAYQDLFVGESALAWAEQVGRLVANNSDHTISRLALAEASVKAELWGQARSKLEGLPWNKINTAQRGKAASLMVHVEEGSKGDAGAALCWSKSAAAAYAEQSIPQIKALPGSLQDLIESV